jgi:hypothetical protein
MRNIFIRDHCHHYRTILIVNRTVRIQRYKALTGCNEAEENNVGPDFAHNGGLEFFSGDPSAKKGI